MGLRSNKPAWSGPDRAAVDEESAASFSPVSAAGRASSVASVAFAVSANWGAESTGAGRVRAARFSPVSAAGRVSSVASVALAGSAA